MIVTLLICYRKVFCVKSPELFAVVISDEVGIIPEELSEDRIIQIIIGSIVRSMDNDSACERRSVPFS